VIQSNGVNQMDVYLEEYSSEDALRRYTSKTAGHGISYLLKHDYADIYLTAINQILQARPNSSLKVLEFGCGAGMNILTLLSFLERKGIKVDAAFGADFSEKLIKAANAESKLLLNTDQQEKVHFVVARSEQLASDLARALSKTKAELVNSFQMILGVNTFRYCHRLEKARESAQEIADLLAPGGICVMIDMNSRFPVFRSRLHDRRTKPENERYLPSLDEYASPFAEVGLEILRKENFSWIPHSASPALTNVCRLLTPLLNVFFKPFAMRSLVVSRKSR
jgi:SAM-dependent methyltransferase